MNNKVALITGCAKGIGRSIAIELAHQKYDIVINYNTSYEEAYELGKLLKDKYNVNTLVVKCDISNEDEVKDMVNIILNKFNKIDVLVNNAAVCIDTLFCDKTVNNFKRTLDVNIVGTFLVSKYVGEIMYNNKCGKIVNISSTNGINTYYPMSIDYDASKAGIISLTHNLAMQFAPYINVNAIAPGFIENDLDEDADEEFIESEKNKIFLHRFGKEEEVAKLVKFLVSDDANYINNSVIRIDGGLYG